MPAEAVKASAAGPIADRDVTAVPEAQGGLAGRVAWARPREVPEVRADPAERRAGIVRRSGEVARDPGEGIVRTAARVVRPGGSSSRRCCRRE